jgi:hypothetical protein
MLSPLASAMKVVLISTYELGHQPFGLASPAAWLREHGVPVAQVDLAVQTLPRDSIATAGLVAFYVPMHTATRIAVKALERVKEINPVRIFAEVVLGDVRRQVEVGARHITFGDPDFFNGPAHAVVIVRDLHREFPDLTYDVTIKIEHLLKQAHLLTILRATGCLFVTSAVESFDNRVLEVLGKRHTREDFERVLTLFRETGLALNPTFVAFNPWSSLEGYQGFLGAILSLDLIENVSPIQYAVRLLIPAGSKLLELAEVRQLVESFDEAALCYPWSHPDPRMDRLYEDVLAVVKRAKKKARSEIFGEVWRIAHDSCENGARERFKALRSSDVPARATIPYLSEPWFC